MSRFSLPLLFVSLFVHALHFRIHVLALSSCCFNVKSYRPFYLRCFQPLQSPTRTSVCIVVLFVCVERLCFATFRSLLLFARVHPYVSYERGRSLPLRSLARVSPPDSPFVPLVAGFTRRGHGGIVKVEDEERYTHVGKIHAEVLRNRRLQGEFYETVIRVARRERFRDGSLHLVPIVSG